MIYQEYIQIGFKRYEMDCKEEIKRTGYGGYSLNKKINSVMMVEVHSSELDNPKLYIRKMNQETYHIIPIKPEVVFSMFYDDDV